MAKQSALNTRTVQKFKEKAKTATEKRLKQMRKAQLKAIKQVERDERYLVKLSNNRRLLKAAHSISDIKLVGRSENAPSNALADRISANTGHPADRASAVLARLSHSPSFATFMHQRADLAAKNGRKKFNFSSTSNSDESAYSSSSISSNSGYLSSCSTSALNKLGQFRPKYSELVAVSLDQGKEAKRQTGEQQSVKSNSTIGTKLRGIAGVSRKVQMKRLLQVGASSTSEQSAAMQTLSERPQPDSSGNQRAANKSKQTLGEQNAPKSSQEPTSGIKWPPAPSMTRATSEPDFSAALRGQSPDSREEAEEVGPRLDQRAEVARPRLNAISAESGPSRQADSCKSDHRDESQHHLLTQCLSQLKSRHEAISGQRESNSDQLIKPSKLAQLRPHVVGKTGAQFGDSDELLQHQLNAGEFPLRPSAIRQQQLNLGAQSTCAQRLAEPQAAGKVTTISVDSIGSAGSFARRNSRASSPKSQSSSTQSTSSPAPSYSSAHSSSIEASSSKLASSAQLQGHNSAGSRLAVESRAIKRPDQSLLVPTAYYDEPLETFLLQNGLIDLSEVFARERIDLEALMLLSEEDLKSLNILLGPRRKLLKAISERKRSAGHLATRNLAHTNPMYVMVDTLL